MCVLIVKNSGVNMPNENIIRACAKANPHGFGFVTPTKFFKTLDVEEFISELYKIEVSEPAIIHCRFATHGSIKKGNCHPFLSKDKKWGFAHNGVLPIASRNDKTDSEIAFTSIFLPYILQYGIQDEETTDKINYVRGSSRFAFMDRTQGYIYTFGAFECINGVMFSNIRWRPYVETSRHYDLFESEVF